MARVEWDPDRLPDLTGRTYLVTGATAGLGYFSCEQLARAGARVIMTGRNPNRLATARAALHTRVPDAATAGTVDTLLLDTSKLGSVRAAAATVRGRRRLDGLLLNAGIVDPPRDRQVADGNELVFATNVLGHFALAGELLTTLAAASGRMVWVGSMATSLWRYPVEDPQLIETYTPWRAYVQSKIATTALGIEADRLLDRQGVPVSSAIAHPGFSMSERTIGIRGVNEPTRRERFWGHLLTAVTQSKEAGAQTLVRTLVDPVVDGGELWGPRLVARGEAREARPAAIARDPELGARLWTACETATGVRWPFTRAARRR